MAQAAEPAPAGADAAGKRPPPPPSRITFRVGAEGGAGAARDLLRAALQKERVPGRLDRLVLDCLLDKGLEEQQDGTLSMCAVSTATLESTCIAAKWPEGLAPPSKKRWLHSVAAEMPGLVSLVRHKGPHDMLLLRVDELAERSQEAAGGKIQIVSLDTVDEEA